MNILRLSVILTTLALSLTGTAHGQWPDDPAVNLLLGGGPGEQTVPHAVVVPAGSGHEGFIYAGWYDSRSGDYNVALQLLTPAGELLFPGDGLIVSSHPQNSWVMDWSLSTDFEGNAIVSFADIRDGNSNIHVYKISPSGEFLWGPDGISLTANPAFKGPPSTTVAANGDVVVVWMQDDSPDALRMQRLTPGGAQLLPAGGVVVSQPEDTSPFGSVLAPAGAEDVILGYVPVYTPWSTRQIKAQRFNAQGQALWPSYVMVMDDSSLPMGHGFQMTPDGTGGVLFCWNVTVGWTFGSRVQRLTAGGLELLQHNGVSANAAGATGQIEPSAVYNPASGEITIVFIEINENQTHRGLYAQRINSAGQRLWGPGGSILTPQNTNLESLPCLTLLNGAVIGTVLYTPGGQYASDLLLGYRIDDSGGHAWGGTVPVASTPSSKGSPLLVSGTATTVAVWTDQRSGTIDTYGQNLNADGTLGGDPASTGDGPWSGQHLPALRIAGHAAHPNPFASMAAISFDLPHAAPVRLCVHDVAGRLVRELLHADLPAGSHRIDWDGRDGAGRQLHSGVYYYRILSAGSPATGAVTLVR